MAACREIKLNTENLIVLLTGIAVETQKNNEDMKSSSSKQLRSILCKKDRRSDSGSITGEAKLAATKPP